MKRVKKIIVAMLCVVMLYSMNSGIITVKTYAADAFAITSPTTGSLKAAGYIDIKWTSASSRATLKNYKLYVDGSLVYTTKNLSYVFYTTKVNYHTAYVVAEFSDGTAQATSNVRFGVTKKGLAVSTDMGQHLEPSQVGAAWYYNWGVTTYSYPGYSSIEYVPMIWGRDSASDNNNSTSRETEISNKVTSFANQGYKYVLGFNEPDLNGQALMSVNEVISLWPSFLNKNIRVGSPATALWPKSSTNWFQPFMTLVNAANSNMYVDFITIHCYPDNFQGQGMATWFLREVVDATWDMYHKPIWITEFSTTGKNITANGTSEFLKYVMPGLDSRDYVERYSYFSFNASNNKAGLWYYSTGALADPGNIYAQYGNPTTDYKTGNNTNTNIQNKVAKPARVTIKSVKNLKGKKVKISLKKVTRAVGYQIRYSDSKKFRGYWTKTTKKTTYTIKKLQKKTRYYIKSRAYVKNGSAKLYGDWSKVKKVKVTK